MKWQDKLAVLKLSGYEIYQSNGWKDYPNEHYRYVCDGERTAARAYGAGDTKAQAVNIAWDKYIRTLENEKAS